MIGSFWNLCRACPSMPVDKLHSEYRSTYRWHEFTGNSRPEIVRRPPLPNQFGPTNEPPLPRRKKCPELAYKSHEFIIGSENLAPTKLTHEDNNVTRTRSEKRGTTSRRSKSEDPPGITNGRGCFIPNGNEVDSKSYGIDPVQAGESNGLLKKTISKLSTEYRMQFVWPQLRKTVKGETNDDMEVPRKSLSMGAIRSSQSHLMPTVHKKRTTKDKEAALFELEPLVNDADKTTTSQRVVPSTRTNRQPERRNQFFTKKENFGFKDENEKTVKEISQNISIMNATCFYGDQWYKDVIELRKKAGEYKSRGWGVEIDGDYDKKQNELWDQVSRRSSLSALSLASSIHRPITKEEKEKENKKKFSPVKSFVRTKDGHANINDSSILPRNQAIRHHLERTTGHDVEDGALLPSPTREKLMPTIPKSKDSEQIGSQRGSPKKYITSRHSSPQKGSPKKGSPQKVSKGRSKSVGPTIDSNESPKRELKQVSSAGMAVGNTKSIKKMPVSVTEERRPRPSTLSTSIHSRSKSSSLPFSGRTHSTIGNHHIQKLQNDTSTKSRNFNVTQPNLRKTNKSLKLMRPKSAVLNVMYNDLTEPTTFTDVQKLTEDRDKKLAESHEESEQKDSRISGSNNSPQAVQELLEHIVKSPPEPTRVKSPEQIIMRSPDPVNWTVPLDTGKTFTVTQNVKEGEHFSRPQSEIKASTPIERCSPAPQSAPPELAELSNMEENLSRFNSEKIG